MMTFIKNYKTKTIKCIFWIFSHHRFFRGFAMRWITTMPVCPITREPMEPEDLVSSRDLAEQIKKWKMENGSGQQQQSSDGQKNPQDDESNSNVDNRLLDIRSRVFAKKKKRLSFNSLDKLVGEPSGEKNSYRGWPQRENNKWKY